MGEIVDRLVLRVSHQEEAGDATAPLEPPEQIYYGLNRLRGVVDAGKLTLLLTSTGSDWNGETASSVSGETLTEYLAEQGARSHYSSRYACGSGDSTIWYLNGQSIQERELLARLFGGGHLCLSDLNNALPEVLAAMP